MNPPSETTALVESAIKRLNAGELNALNDVIERAAERLRTIASRILHGEFQRIPASLEQPDDIAQAAALRLLVDLRKNPLRVGSALEFFRFSARMMRNVLNDVARNQFGPEGSARNRADVPLGGSSSIPGFIPPDPKITAPDELMARSEFHECVEKLPRDLRDVVDLHSYQEFTLKEVADLLDIGVATAQRRWSRAKIALIKLLHNFRPEHL